MLGENLEIVPPPFGDMLEDDKKFQDKLNFLPTSTWMLNGIFIYVNSLSD